MSLRIRAAPGEHASQANDAVPDRQASPAASCRVRSSITAANTRRTDDVPCIGCFDSVDHIELFGLSNDPYGLFLRGIFLFFTCNFLQNVVHQ